METKELKTNEKELIKELVEALLWCSGSNDFQEDGIAREGWLKVKELIDEALEYLKQNIMETQELIIHLENYYYSVYNKEDDTNTIKIRLYNDLKNYMFEYICCGGEEGYFYDKYFFRLKDIRKILEWLKDDTGTDFKDLKNIYEAIENFGWIDVTSIKLDVTGNFANEIVNYLYK